MRLRHICVGAALLLAMVVSGCCYPRACYRPCPPPCPPAASFYPAPAACPCNGNGVAVQAFNGGPPVVANPVHP